MYQVNESDQSKKLVHQSNGPELNCTDAFWHVIETLDKQRAVPAPVVKLGLLSQHLEPEPDSYETRVKNEAIESASIAIVPSQTLARVRWLLSNHSTHLDSSEKKRIGKLCQNSGLNRPPESVELDSNRGKSTYSRIVNKSIFVRKDKKNIECEHCGNKYQYTNKLNKHIANCSERPTEKSGYEQNIENNFDKFICEHCGNEYQSTVTLNNHLPNCSKNPTKNENPKSEKENKKEYVCESCEKSFTRKSKLRVHEKRNCGTYDCENCEKSFESKSKLRKHKKQSCDKKQNDRKKQNKNTSNTKPAFGKNIRKDKGSERVSGRNPFADPQRLKDTGIHQGGN